MALKRFGDRSVQTMGRYQGGGFSGGDVPYNFQLKRNSVIITHGGVYKGTAKWVKGAWSPDSHGLSVQDLAVLRHEAPNGPEDIKRAIGVKNMQQNPRRRRRRGRKLSKHCQQIVSRTAATEQRAGYPRAQAVAIGYSKARKAGCRVPPAPRAELEDNPTAFWGKFLG